MALIHEALVGLGDDVWSTTNDAAAGSSITLNSPAAGDLAISLAAGDTVRRSVSVALAAGDLVLTNSRVRFRLKSLAIDTSGGAASFRFRLHLRTSEFGPFYDLVVDGGNIRFDKFAFGSMTNVWASTAFSALSHEWVEIAADASNTTIRTAPDNGSDQPGTWTDRGTTANQAETCADASAYIELNRAGFGGATSLVMGAFNAPAGTVHTGAIAETLAASEAVSAVHGLAGGVAEVGAASETLGSAGALAATRVDAGAAADATSSGAGTYPVAIAEAAGASDVASGVLTLVSARTDALAGQDGPSCVGSFLAARSDAMAAAEVSNWGGAVYGVAIDEVAAASDQRSAGAGLVAARLEVLAAADVLASLLAGTTALTETSPAIDAATGLVVRSAALAEAAAAADAPSSSLGVIPVTPTWPAGGPARLGGTRLVDGSDRIGGRVLRGSSRRIG